MNYELAKKLKDAGFIQGEGTDCTLDFIEPDGNLSSNWNNGEGSCYIPALSELIDACGNGFSELHRIDNGFMATGGGKDQTGLDLIHVYGVTPEETLANLWLELTKQK